MSETSPTFMEHLDELRGRVVKSILCVIASMLVLCNFSDAIIAVMARPVGKLIFLAPQEAFVANLKVAFWGALFVSSPVVIYQIWQFVAAGLEQKEKRYAYIFAPISFGLFFTGMAFAYLIIIPVGLKVLLSFGNDTITPMIGVSQYVSFVSGLTLVFGFVYQVPLILMFLTRVGITTPDTFSKNRRLAIVLIFIISATLTPPDVVSQISMAIPLYGLFELGIFFSKLVHKSMSRHAPEGVSDDATL